MIQAIETRYKGYRFRSRLEARWAVFFDTLGIEWEYEKEGYKLGDTGLLYLPDFWLPLGCFVEVKGQKPTLDELEKAKELAHQSGDPVVIVTDCWYDAPMNLFAISSDKAMGFIATGERWTCCAECYWLAVANHVKGKAYVYCLNPACKHSANKFDMAENEIDWSTPADGFKKYRPAAIKKYPELKDGWIAMNDESIRYVSTLKLIGEAYTAARAARFEHGETPRVPRGKPRKGA